MQKKRKRIATSFSQLNFVTYDHDHDIGTGPLHITSTKDDIYFDLTRLIHQLLAIQCKE